MDQVNVRLDADVAAALKADAERGGVTMTGYLNELLRRTIRECRETRPVYLPPGRTPEAIQVFHQNVGSHRKYLWVFRDLNQPVVWMLPAVLEGAHDLHVVVRPAGGRAMALPLDNLVAWSPYTSEHERIGLMHPWHQAGAAVHPWTTESFRPS